EAADLGRSHAVQGEAALVVGVDELVGGRRCPGKDAEPGKGIAALVGFGSECRAGDAVRAIAARHELAGKGCLFAVAAVSDAGMVIVDALDRGCLGLEPDLAPVRQALFDEVLDYFLLAINGDAATGQPAEIDAVFLAGEAQLDAVVREAFACHALAHAGRDEQIGGSLFQDTRPYSPLDVVPAAALKHDGRD